MSLHHGLRSAAGASVADPYFANTSLLLLGNGTNGGQNNTFTDGSSNAFSVTRYGNTTQGSFSPFGYNWSNYFDGSGDDLRLSSSSAFSLGTGDFTFEAWINPANWTNTAIPFFVVTATGGLWIGKNGSNFVVRAFGVADQLTYSTMPTVGTWTHIVAVRSGTTLSLYYNGSRAATTTNSYSFAQGGLAIGSDADSYSTAYYTGHLSNVRLVKGTAVYDPTQTTLTVPTAPLTAITNTSLLTCQSNRFLDNSSNAFTITPYGNASITNFAPFPTNSEYSTGTNGGSGYFDGSGDYLQIANNSAFNLGSSNFTVEAWIYPTTSGTARQIIAKNQGSYPTGYEINFSLSDTNLLQFASYGTSFFYASSTGAVSANTWTHVAAVRNGSTITLYINGVADGTVTAQTIQTTTSDLTVARDLETGSGGRYFTGFISSARILKGTAQYTANFTPSTTPLTAITNTSLLLNFTIASIIDSTGKNDLETVGDAQISTSVKKFGTGALKFDGTGDYLTIPKSSLLDFGTGDFTIEAWINPTAASGTIIDTRTQDTLDAYIFNILGASGKLDFVYSSSRVTSSGAISTSVWTHVAVVRSSGTIKLYINGTEDGSASYSSAINAQAFASIGGGRSSSSTSVNGYYFNGYIDDLRITRGVARYTAAFTPPSRQLPAR